MEEELELLEVDGIGAPLMSEGGHRGRAMPRVTSPTEHAERTAQPAALDQRGAPGLPQHRSRAARRRREVRCAARGRPCRRTRAARGARLRWGGELPLIGRWQGWAPGKRRLPAPSSATAGCARAAAASKGDASRRFQRLDREGQRGLRRGSAAAWELGTRMAHPLAVSPVARAPSRGAGGRSR